MNHLTENQFAVAGKNPLAQKGSRKTSLIVTKLATTSGRAPVTAPKNQCPAEGKESTRPGANDATTEVRPQNGSGRRAGDGGCGNKDSAT